MATCDRSYSRFWMSRWSGVIGRKGWATAAKSTLNMLPKFELAAILMYLMALPNVVCPFALLEPANPDGNGPRRRHDPGPAF
jgi:hypothetical protein